MNRFRAIAIASCLMLSGLFLAPESKADEWNKKTIITINQPVSVGGTVLQPGKYVMKLFDSPSNRHLVQIFNEDETRLEATVNAMPNYRIRPTDGTVITTEEVPAGTPAPMRAWFYPGDNSGQEFPVQPVPNIQSAAVTYNQGQATEIARAEPAPAPAPAPEPAPAPAPEPQQQAQAQPAPEPAPAPAPAPEAAPAPPPAPEAPRSLPSTGSPLPLVGLAGMLSMGAGLVMRKFRG